MKAALIPPKGKELTALSSQIHLVLPIPDTVKNETYIDVYRRARSRGDYVILDNGCAEGQLVRAGVLLAFANTIGAHEIVAPDVMGDTLATHTATTKFLADCPGASDYNIMGVLQGNNWFWLAREFNKIDAITSIGIPKVYVKFYTSKLRAHIAKRIMHEFPGRFQIHLLGLSSNFPSELVNVSFPEGIRSVDSALPYKAAEEDKLLSAHRVTWSKRRDDYFTREEDADPVVLEANISTFMKWAAEHD